MTVLKLTHHKMKPTDFKKKFSTNHIIKSFDTKMYKKNKKITNTKKINNFAIPTSNKTTKSVNTNKSKTKKPNETKKTNETKKPNETKNETSSINKNKIKYTDLYKSVLNMDNHTILVIMSTYNRSKLVIKSIESIIKQTYNNWVIHIVDDSSTDDSVNVIMEYLNNSKPNNVIFTKNSNNVGTYANKNYVLHYHHKQKFGYWTTQDSDDVSNPTRFETCLKYISNSNNLLAVNCLCSRKGLINRTRYSEGIIIYKRQVLNDIGYYDINRFGCDTDYYTRFRMFYKTNKIYLVNIVLYDAISDSNGLTVNYQQNERIKYQIKCKIYYKKTLFRKFQN